MFRRRVLTKAPPLPGLTCWKYRIVNRLPSTRMAEPFLNWLVDIMLASSPSWRPIFAAVLRGANPAQTPGYYRTVSFRVSRPAKTPVDKYDPENRPPWEARDLASRRRPLSDARYRTFRHHLET